MKDAIVSEKWLIMTPKILFPSENIHTPCPRKKL